MSKVYIIEHLLGAEIEFVRVSETTTYLTIVEKWIKN